MMLVTYHGEVATDVRLPSRTLTLVPFASSSVTDEEATILASVPGAHVTGKPTTKPPSPPASAASEPVVKKSRRKAISEENDGNATVQG